MFRFCFSGRGLERRRSVLNANGVLHVELMTETEGKKSCLRIKMLDPFAQGNWGRGTRGGWQGGGSIGLSC